MATLTTQTAAQADGDTQSLPQKSGVINPYALAELVAGEKIPWKKLPDAPRVLEQLLATPYEELFDPKYGGPLYVGSRLDENNQVVPERSPLLDFVQPQKGSDAEMNGSADLSQYTNLKQVLENPDFARLIEWPIQCIDFSRLSQFSISLKVPPSLRMLQLGKAFSPEVVQSITFDPSKIQIYTTAGWTPPGGHWDTAGNFYKETAEFFDPVQGAVANCYYIAAMSAIAWATPFRIAHQTRATGQAQNQFNDMMRFYKPNGAGAIDKDIQVTERVPLDAGGNFIYCRSNESGETWPAIYEKAFAKLTTGTATDMPDITQTAYGDPVWATAQLNGGATASFDTASRSADDLWNILRSNCLSYKTFNPMTAWTYGTSGSTPSAVEYNDAGVVANHAYTVLGWAYQNCKRWIVLRNPWGFQEPTAALDATIQMYDVSWWRPLALKPNDGVFAMEISAFKKYFAGFGRAV